MSQHMPQRGSGAMASGALMHELEAILHEYLSFNWDRMEEMSNANAACQRKEGLACPWRPSRDIQHSVSTCNASLQQRSKASHVFELRSPKIPSWCQTAELPFFLPLVKT